MECHGVCRDDGGRKLTSENSVISLDVTFILRSNYHEGKFILFERNRHWNGHINAFHVSHEFAKRLIGMKIDDYIVADLGLGIYDSYQITQIKKAPNYDIHADAHPNVNEISGHRQRWIDGARERWVFKGNTPETTLADLYAEIKSNSRGIQLRDLRPPMKIVRKKDSNQESIKIAPRENGSRTLDQETIKVVNLLEITELKLGIALRSNELWAIEKTFREAEMIIASIHPRFHNLFRYKSLLVRMREARNWMPGVIGH